MKFDSGVLFFIKTFKPKFTGYFIVERKKIEEKGIPKLECSPKYDKQICLIVILSTCT